MRERPLVSLLGASPILSILTQMILVIAAQTVMFINVQEQPWWVPGSLWIKGAGGVRGGEIHKQFFL